MRNLTKCLGSLCVFAVAAPALLAQRDRILAKIDNTDRVTLKGHLHPKARSDSDQGPVDPSLKLTYLTMVLKPSPTQQAELDRLLAEQQDPTSPNYDRWLTPEQYADRFGASPDDINKIVSWLQQQNLTVQAIGRARNSISFSGTAGRIQSAFHTEIHHYLVNGKMHYANATDPSIPAAFQAVVGGIHGLNDFRMRPPRGASSVVPNSRTLRPQYTSAKGEHFLAPDDVALIYNIKPLYAAGIDGSGQKVAVAGQTQIDPADIKQFRSYFNLPANDPQVVLVPNETDPGIVKDDLSEADLDIELAGAVARNATVVYVYAKDVMTAVQYAIDQDLAPVLSVSYGSCEAETSASDAAQMQAWAKQANAQGMTWFAASGDAGGADCAGGFSRNSGVPSVDLPAGVPEVTGIGGTEFNEGDGNYWNATGDANHASALSYIPEVAWNDSATDGAPSASGGGPSVIFAKPAWQTGTGVPDDGARDVPDVSLAGSADHDGYLIYSSGSLSVVGGTSVGAPTFAGIAALLNHYLAVNAQAAPGLGNINPMLYSLAQTSPASFHDIVSGDNMVTACSHFRACSGTPVGYNTGPGYDLVTGLGSVDVFNLITAWHNNTGAVTQASAPSGPPSIAGVTNGASFAQAYAPGMILSVFGSQLAPGAASARTVPLPTQMLGVTVTIGGAAAPLYYISPGQLNVQIPYTVSPNSQAVLTVNNNGQTASFTFPVAAAAPGIFTDQSGAIVPSAAASRGQITTLFITGDGAVSPAIVAGTAPGTGTAIADLPRPVQPVTVSVGGIQAAIDFIGIPGQLVGVTQINFEVPAQAPLGIQSVFVSVGGVASPAARLVVNP